tara:strand:- start:314 stop:1387 length:1074 start_codon:yes stop_codon:yes gene_type:complete
VNTKLGFVVLESGECFPGQWHGGPSKAGELVFNTSHSGYEEMATDPSYYSQILITTASQQGNYGEKDEDKESEQIWIHGFVCLELQNSKRDHAWREKLLQSQVPIVTEVDTRSLTLELREKGTTWGALVEAQNKSEAIELAKSLIAEEKRKDLDWAHRVSTKEVVSLQGENPQGPKVCVIDFGCKKNIIRELRSRCSEVILVPSRFEEQQVRDLDPQGILLSNGPGNPEDVQVAAESLRGLLGWRPVFGICMGHQILGRALGAKTFKLKYGHRGANHPIKDDLLSQIYMTSQNHGYAVEEQSLPKNVKVTHRNLNDGTVAGIEAQDQKAFSVQFHPESHPGPHDSVALFDYFVKQIQ